MFCKGGTNVPLEPLASPLPFHLTQEAPWFSRTSGYNSHAPSTLLLAKQAAERDALFVQGHLPNGSWVVTTRSLDGGRHTAARW